MRLNLSRILTLDCFAGANVLAGHRGLEREVRLVNVMEVPDISNWVSENELILTTAYPFKDDPQALGALISQLSGQKVSGLAIKLSRFIKSLPAQVVEIADRLDFPLISLPSHVQFDRIILEAFSHIIEEDYVEIKASEGLSKHLQEISMNGGTLGEIAKALTERCGGEVLIKGAEGQLLAQSSADAVRPDASGSTGYEKQIAFDGKTYASLTLNLWHRTPNHVDLSLLNSAVSPIMMILFQSSLRAHIKKREESLNDLILGKMVLSNKNIEYVSSFGVDFASSCTVCVLRAGRLHGQSYDLLAESIARVLEERMGVEDFWPVSTKMQGCMVHLCFGEQYSPAALVGIYKRLLSEVSRVMPDIRLSVGIGRHIQQTQRINAGFLEAQRALDMAEALSVRGGVYLYEELVVESLLSRLTPDDELTEFVRAELGALLLYDQRRKKQYLQTLEQLLSGESIKEISERMFLHPKTLVYRKSSIEKILGESIDSQNKRLRLSMALKLFRLNRLRCLDELDDSP